MINKEKRRDYWRRYRVNYTMYRDTATREYKYRKKSNGEEITYEITVRNYGETVEVSEEIYAALIRDYWRFDGKTRSMHEKTLSLDYTYNNYASNGENNDLYDFMISDMPTPEEVCLEKELDKKLLQALEQLSNSEKELIVNLVIKKVPFRDYAKKINRPASTVHYQLEKAKKKLRKIYFLLNKN